MIGSIGSNAIPGMWGKSSDIARAAGPSGVEGIEGISKPASLRSTESAGAPATGASFSKVLEQAVHEVDDKMKIASADQNKLLSGETNNLHQAMISMQESSVAFSLMVEVRNKLVDSYQELMRMQV
ncbi:MAG: flagellar hook-basal body complex protein FliE [Chthoniobacteraceae bacterium]|nr:flagellar hook-basal body complex protein FliE [Chthoniobacteraceae bacterium]